MRLDLTDVRFAANISIMDMLEKAEALPMTPAIFHILLSLVDGPRHGYSIMQDVDGRTRGEFQLAPGTLYRSLQKMLEVGLVESQSTPSRAERHDTRKRTYHLTAQGLEVAKNEARRLERLVKMARSKELIPTSQES